MGLGTEPGPNSERGEFAFKPGRLRSPRGGSNLNWDGAFPKAGLLWGGGRGGPSQYCRNRSATKGGGTFFGGSEKIQYNGGGKPPKFTGRHSTGGRGKNKPPRGPFSRASGGQAESAKTAGFIFRINFANRFLPYGRGAILFQRGAVGEITGGVGGGAFSGEGSTGDGKVEPPFNFFSGWRLGRPFGRKPGPGLLFTDALSPHRRKRGILWGGAGNFPPPR